MASQDSSEISTESRKKEKFSLASWHQGQQKVAGTPSGAFYGIDPTYN
jgi:hypothetical protein